MKKILLRLPDHMAEEIKNFATKVGASQNWMIMNMLSRQMEHTRSWANKNPGEATGVASKDAPPEQTKPCIEKTQPIVEANQLAIEKIRKTLKEKFFREMHLDDDKWATMGQEAKRRVLDHYNKCRPYDSINFEI